MRHGNQGDRSRAMRLMEALSAADEELLERSGEGMGEAVSRPLWRSARTVAAAACLVLVAGASWGGYQLSQMRMGYSGGSSKGAAPQQSAIDASEEAAAEGAFGADLDEAGAAEAVTDGAGAPAEEAMDAKKDAVTGEGAAAGGNAAAEENAAAEGNVAAGDNVVAENGIPMGAGVNSVDSSQAKADSAEAVERESDARTEVSLAPKTVKLTEAQARDDAEFGGYVPEALPQGYVFGFASRDAGTGHLTLCWSRGTDSILLSLSHPEEAPAPVDIAQKESYDLRLYKVSYGLMMPAEMDLESFQDPVFAAEDFTLEAVESRMISYQDQKDTDTPRGNFSVLYPDGTLAQFNGRGTAEEIWEMFCSMAESPCRLPLAGATGSRSPGSGSPRPLL